MKKVWDFPFAVASDKTVDVIIAETRASALEDAAKACEKLHRKGTTDVVTATIKCCARTIRELK